MLIRDFSNLDLSNIDLSSIPIEAWEDCIFYNTNFKNTGIKFIPNKLRKVSINKSKESAYPSFSQLGKGTPIAGMQSAGGDSFFLGEKS